MSEAISKRFQYILCANKATDPAATAALFKDIAAEQTTFVLMQNGVGNEDPFRDAFPSCTIISGVVWVGGVQGTPGVIKHTKNEDTQIGLFPNPKLEPSIEKERLNVFRDLMLNGGTRVDVEDNIQVQRWVSALREKMLWKLELLTDM